MNTTTFQYRRAYRIVNWGCSFDSLTEVKFAISIRDDYALLRERVSIHYDPATAMPTGYVRSIHRRYTPDFLIRHRETRQAWLIEIKPRAAEQEPGLALYKRVAENYIRWKKYDWQFKIVFDDEILLSEEQLIDFEECCQLKSESARKLWMQEYNQKMDRSAPRLFKGIPPQTDVRFVLFGDPGKHHR